jgi:hypothetical protein
LGLRLILRLRLRLRLRLATAAEASARRGLAESAAAEVLGSKLLGLPEATAAEASARRGLVEAAATALDYPVACYRVPRVIKLGSHTMACKILILFGSLTQFSSRLPPNGPVGAHAESKSCAKLSSGGRSAPVFCIFRGRLIFEK